MSRNETSRAQNALMSAIYGQTEPQSFDPQGLAVYRSGLAANAKRALQVSFPTVERLVGNDCFTLLATHFLQVQPLKTGDWGEWGHQLPAWIAANTDFDEYPYLSDCAQLDWLCHQSERAADVMADTASLSLLGEQDPYQLTIQLCSGTALLPSSHPVVDIWNAHHAANHQELLTQAAQSIANQQPQIALIFRPEWKAQVSLLNASELLWLQHMLAGHSIGSALDGVSHTDFSFEAWLPQALQTGLLCAIKPLASS